jgi:hypothetical protein
MMGFSVSEVSAPFYTRLQVLMDIYAIACISLIMEPGGFTTGDYGLVSGEQIRYIISGLLDGYRFLSTSGRPWSPFITGEPAEVRSFVY